MRPAAMARILLAGLLAVVLGGFSLFVGYNKALAPLEVLREHTAWTIHLPVLLGRTLGWLEIAAALVLIASIALRRLAVAGWWAGAWITLNHAVAAVFHVAHAEWQTLPQSAVMITMCATLLVLSRPRSGTTPLMKETFR